MIRIAAFTLAGLTAIALLVTATQSVANHPVTDAGAVEIWLRE